MPGDVVVPEDERQAGVLRDLLRMELDQREARADPHQLRDIVGWRRFIYDPYYSGAFATLLYDYWRGEIADFLDGDATEWIITGSLGGGKSTAAMGLIMFKLYELSCYEHPARLFGLGDISDLVFGVLGPGGATNDESFVRLRRAIDTSPYFREHCPRNTDRDSILQFPTKNLRVLYGSGRTRGGAVVSTDLLGVVLDEANFLKASGTSKVGDVGMARDTFTATRRRRRSRFVSQGADPSFSVLVSSVDHDASFTEQQIAEAKRLGQPQKVTITNPWLAKPEGTYSSETFFVFKGTEERDPQIVDSPLDVPHVLERSMSDVTELYRRASREGAEIGDVVDWLPLMKKQLFVEVPVDFRSDFEQDVRGALKDIAGSSVKRIGKLFTSRPTYLAACSRAPLKHPFTSETVCVSREGTSGLVSRFLPDVLFDPDTKMFRRHPYAHRYVHVDSSETECPTGITMCHQAGVKEDPISRMSLPVIEMDFVLRIVPPEKPDKISVMKIARFWLWLVENYNVVFGAITYDQWGSQGPLDVLQEHGISCDRYAAAGDYGAWKDYVRLYEDGRICVYDYGPLHEELFALVDDRVRREVTNPNSWKDVMDSQVGAVTQCMMKASYSPQQTAQELLDDRVRRVRRPGSADSVKDEMKWVVAGYKGRSAQKDAGAERRGVDVDKTEIEGELGKA